VLQATRTTSGTQGEETVVADRYYFCLQHHEVEGEDGCPARDRLGPYASAEEASRALEKVAERNQAWDNDPRWNDDLED
jgi:hypothetical protein